MDWGPETVVATDTVTGQGCEEASFIVLTLGTAGLHEAIFSFQIPPLWTVTASSLEGHPEEYLSLIKF